MNFIQCTKSTESHNFVVPFWLSIDTQSVLRIRTTFDGPGSDLGVRIRLRILNKKN